MYRSVRGTGAETTQPWVLPTHQHRSRQKRDRLLKAGERVFAAHGFADAHVSEIVRRAGCSVGSFYRRFKDKESLFLALQGDIYDRARLRIDRFFSHPICESASLTHVCFRLFETIAAESVKARGYYRALIEISLRGVKVWERMRELERYQAENLQRLFAKRGFPNLRPDFVPAVAGTIRMIAGNQLSMLLHGGGPFEHNDFPSTLEFTRILMGVAGVPFDETELARLKAARRRSRRNGH